MTNKTSAKTPLSSSDHANSAHANSAHAKSDRAETAHADVPRAQKRPHQHTEHGVVRDDPYHWMRDDDREDKAVLKHLELENAYAAAVMHDTEALQKALFEEMVGRIKQDDNSVPVFVDGYWHYRRFEKGAEQPIYCRKQGTADDADEQRDADQGTEEILLDANLPAKDHEYYQVASLQTTRLGDIVAWAEDTVSRRIYTVRFKDPQSGNMLDDVLEDTTGNFTFADRSDVVYYAKREKGTLRAYQIWRHEMGSPSADDVLIFEETDDTFHVGVYRSKSNHYMIIQSSSTLTEEARFALAAERAPAFQVFLPRDRGHEYQIGHAGDRFYVRSNKDAVNFKLMAVAPDKTSDLAAWEEVVAHRDDVLLEDFDLFARHLVIGERTEANTRLRVIPWDSPSQDHIIDADEPAYTMWSGANPAFHTDVLRFGYESLITPDSTFDYNMVSKERTLKKQREVLGGYDAGAYLSERLWATARDGTRIPISIAYRRDLDRGKPQPLYLMGYGSYGLSSDPGFSYSRVSLLDRGLIIAIAHIRGGSEMGRPWYDDGKLLKKQNTFSDFIDVAAFLQQEKITTAAQTVGMGGSAGGLLVGAVANQAPERFGAIVAHVPFVDVVTTMLDDTIPLTTFEYDEWGNPNEKEAFDCMLAYSPYDNVTEQQMPTMLVMTGLHDSQVQYWEPMKWVARLRDQHLVRQEAEGQEAEGQASSTSADASLLVFKTNMEAGHGGASGRFKPYEEKAFETAFVLKVLGLPLR